MPPPILITYVRSNFPITESQRKRKNCFANRKFSFSGGSTVFWMTYKIFRSKPIDLSIVHWKIYKITIVSQPCIKHPCIKHTPILHFTINNATMTWFFELAWDRIWWEYIWICIERDEEKHIHTIYYVIENQIVICDRWHLLLFEIALL